MDSLLLLVVLLMTLDQLQCIIIIANTNSMATVYSLLLLRIAQLQCILIINTNLMTTAHNLLLFGIIQLQQCILVAQYCQQQYINANRILSQQQDDILVTCIAVEETGEQ